MHLPADPYTTERQSQASKMSLALRPGMQLWIVRGAWMLLAGSASGLFLVGLPTYLATLQTTCQAATCHPQQVTLMQAKTLQRFGISLQGYAWYLCTLAVITAAIFLTVGLLIFWRKSTEPMALFTSLMLVIFGVTFLGGPLAALDRPLQYAATGIGILGETCAVLFVFLFPSGRFVPRWTALLALAWIIDGSVGILGLVPDSASAQLLSFLGFALPAGCSIGAQIYRYRRASDLVQRQQTKWVVFGITVALGGIVLLSIGEMVLDARFPNAFPFALAQLTGMLLCLLALPLSLGVATLRYRLFAIDPLIYRTLLYSTLTACIIGLYVLVVGYLSLVFRTSANLLMSLVATGLIAFLFQPLHAWLQHGVSRLLYGQRDEPYRVLAQLGSQLEGTLAPEETLSTIVTTIKEALKLPYAAIVLHQEDASDVTAECGHPVDDVLPLPLTYASEAVGELRVAPRGAGEGFSPADLRLLGDFARQAGTAVHAVQLTMNLQRARERLILAREEERRRLRNDLHDGIGPRLASLNLKIETARNRLAHEPLAGTLLADLARETRAVVADVRQVVYGLRPPVLDELGLIVAVRELAAQQSHEATQITCDLPEELPTLPAAVEVAVYRIVQEALTNVMRHAQAHTCSVRLSVARDAGLVSVEVQDDGRSYDAKPPAGVGIHSMRERAAELGGTLTIEKGTSGGTHLRVRLPYRAEEKEEHATEGKLL